MVEVELTTGEKYEGCTLTSFNRNGASPVGSGEEFVITDCDDVPNKPTSVLHPIKSTFGIEQLYNMEGGCYITPSLESGKIHFFCPDQKK